MASEKDLYHSSVLEFAHKIDHTSVFLNMSLYDLFDPVAFADYLERRFIDLDAECGIECNPERLKEREVRLALLRSDTLESVSQMEDAIYSKLRQVIFGLTGLSKQTDEHFVDASNMIKKIVRQKEWADELFAELETQWANFAHVTEHIKISSFCETDDRLVISNIVRTCFSDGNVRNVSVDDNVYQYCPTSTLAWKEIMGDVLEKVWRNQPVEEKDATSLDSADVVISLSNGRRMQLGSSEWGHVSGFNVE